MSTVVAAAVQMTPVLGDLVATARITDAAIEEAAGRGATLVVLPELATTGYAFADAEEARAVAEPVPGPTTARWTALAARLGVVIVAGLLERDEEGRLRNSAVVVDASGVRAVYRKVHAWDREAEIFAAGEVPAPVVDTAVGRIGVAICYDLWFPEVPRGLALQGADILAIPANLTGAVAGPGEQHVYVATAVASAHVSRMHLVLADRSGVERGTQWLGSSVIVDAHGAVVAGPPPPGEPALLVAPLDLAAARDKRWGPHNDLVADRRPSAYPAALTARRDA